MRNGVRSRASRPPDPDHPARHGPIRPPTRQDGGQAASRRGKKALRPPRALWTRLAGFCLIPATWSATTRCAALSRHVAVIAIRDGMAASVAELLRRDLGRHLSATLRMDDDDFGLCRRRLRRCIAGLSCVVWPPCVGPSPADPSPGWLRVGGVMEPCKACGSRQGWVQAGSLTCDTATKTWNDRAGHHGSIEAQPTVEPAATATTSGLSLMGCHKQQCRQPW
jgi:hypothetical protein